MTMLGDAPVAYEPLAAVTSGTGVTPSPPILDIIDTILSQYANSPILLKLVRFFIEWFASGDRFDAWYRDVWNTATAKGYGLDLWGRILGVTRVLEVPAGVYLGFEQDEQARPFGFGILYRGGRSTNSAALTDAAYRLLLLAKAALNITDGSTPSTNKILIALFGDGYVRDNGDLTITYVFSRTLTPVETAIIYQSGAIPKPIGVSFTVEQP